MSLTKVKRVVAATVVLVGLLSASVAQAGTAWDTYKSRFLMPDGRIVDTGNKNVSHTEGQGFAMLMALANDDRASFVTGEGYGLRLIAWVDIVAVEGNLLRSTCVRSALLFLLCRLFLGIVCHSDLLNTRCRSRKFSFSTSCKTWARKSNAKACNASHQNKT